MSTESSAPHDHGKDLTVVIHNEDAGGEPYEVHAGPGTPVREVIARFYQELGSEQQQGDRLICIGNGQDVFSHGDEHLGEYQQASCTALEWGFSRQTGGA